MTALTTLDLDLVAALQLRVHRLKGPNRQVGLEILAAVDPTSLEGKHAASMLQNPNAGLPADLPGNLDITASMDAALALFGRLLPDADWSFFYNKHSFGCTGAPVVRSDGFYSVHIEALRVLHIGAGWTPPTCLIDGILRAIQPRDDEVYESALRRGVPCELDPSDPLHAVLRTLNGEPPEEAPQ